MRYSYTIRVCLKIVHSHRDGEVRREEKTESRALAEAHDDKNRQHIG